MSPLSPDDPRFTAYADGELSGEEAERFEAELAAHPEARAWLEQTRAVQEGLRAALNEEALEEAEAQVLEERLNRIEKLDTKQTGEGRLSWWWGGAVAAGLAVIMTVVMPRVGEVRGSGWRQADASNLRQIGQASLLYVADHRDRLPEAESVWEYAAELARGASLNDASMWVSRGDLASREWDRQLVRVVDERGEMLDGFRALKLGWAVPLGELLVGLGSEVPVAWTRGLREDGTWADHAPYGNSGGYVVFMGGNVEFYRDLRENGGVLKRFSDGGKTANILEALPPGTRFGEYVPTDEEAARWGQENRERVRAERRMRFWMHPGMWVVYIVSGSMLVAWSVRWWGGIVIWGLVIGAMVLVMLGWPPSCGRSG